MSSTEETEAKIKALDSLRVDLSYIERVYRDLAGMDVELDPDPIEFGPTRLNEKTAEIRSMLTALEGVFLQCSHDQAKIKRQFRKQQALIKIKTNKLLAEDPLVRAQRSASERNAVAEVMLADDLAVLEVLHEGIEEYDNVLTVVRAKRTDLKDTSGRLRDQIRLVKESIDSLGMRWGTATSDQGTSKSATKSSEVTVGALDDLIHKGKMPKDKKDKKDKKGKKASKFSVEDMDVHLDGLFDGIRESKPPAPSNGAKARPVIAADDIAARILAEVGLPSFDDESPEPVPSLLRGHAEAASVDSFLSGLNAPLPSSKPDPFKGADDGIDSVLDDLLI